MLVNKYPLLSIYQGLYNLYVNFINKNLHQQITERMENSKEMTTSMVRQGHERAQKKFNKQVARNACEQIQELHSVSRSQEIKYNQNLLQKQRQKQEKSPEKQDKNLTLDEKLKMRKYDYLNKYNQHQLLSQSYQSCLQTSSHKQNVNINVETKNNRDQSKIHIFKRLQRQPAQQKRSHPICSSLQSKKKYHGPKLNNSSLKSRSPSSSRSGQQLKARLPHFKYLEAYQNNVSPDPFNSVVNSNYNCSSTYASPKKPFMNAFVINQTFADEDKSLNSTKKSLKQAITRIPNHSHGLTVEISHQNELFRGQVGQYRRLVAKLQIDLMNKKQQLANVKQSATNQKLCYEQIICALKEEIKMLAGYRQRYEILNTQMLQLHNQKFNLSLQDKIHSNTNKQHNQVQKTELERGKNIQRTIFSRLEKAIGLSVGKKNEEGANYQMSKFIQEILQKIEKIVERNKKYEDLIYSIQEMHKKIEKNNKQSHYEGSSNLSIKQLWKWLKYVGSVYNFTLEIKPLACEKIGLSQKQSHKLEIKNILEMLLTKT